MSDNTSWQPPVSPNQPQQTAPGPFAAPAPAPGHQFAPPAPPPGQQYATPAPPPGWTPPPKPGLIPLRPLTIGPILGAAFQVMRRNPRPTFGFSLLLNGIVSLIAVGVVGLVAVFLFGRISNVSAANQDAVVVGAIGQLYLSMLVPLILGIVATAILQGIISLEVARGSVGEKLTLRGLWNGARGRIGALLGWAFTLVGGGLLVFLVAAVLLGLIVAFGGDAGIGFAVLLGILMYLGSIVLFAWIATRVSLVPSAIMIERLKFRDAIARSWTLTIRFFWRTLGIQLLVLVIVGVVGQIASIPLSFIAPLLLTFINPAGDNTTLIVVSIVVVLLSFLLVLVVTSMTAIIQSATSALLYIDLRMRKEGLDIELTRFVEARQAGDASVPDPFLYRQPPLPGTQQASQRPGASTAPPPPSTGESPWA